MTCGRMSSESVLTTSTLDLIERIVSASRPSGVMYLLKPFVRMTCAMAIPMTDPSNWMQDAIPVALTRKVNVATKVCNFDTVQLTLRQ